MEQLEEAIFSPESRAQLQTMAEALRPAARIVALTGAGISTESGIPDYRSPNGVWSKQAPIYYADFVRSEAVRRRYWARSLNGYSRFRQAQPNRGHLALARLEGAGRLHALITQNVDRLHTLAGSRRVIELHGNNASVRCIQCGYIEPRKETQARLEWENRHVRLPADDTGDALDVVPPTCPQCAGLVKPAVVFFGETLPPDTVVEASEGVAEADALLVVGTSLTVWSGYRLVRQARAAHTPVYMINIGPTRADAEVAMKIEAPAGEALEQLATYLTEKY
jgi:NAD-dependent SIR2 family protein deacetylase